jgi:hypothetical protein
MGLVAGLLFTGALIYAIYKYVLSPAARKKLNSEIIETPTDHLIIAIGVVFTFGLFWGVLLPPLGQINIGGFKLWQISGLGAAIWLVVFWSRLRPK